MSSCSKRRPTSGKTWSGSCSTTCKTRCPSRCRYRSRLAGARTGERRTEGTASVSARAEATCRPPEDSRRQREPERRSPAQSAGKAERSECRAREDYGWGWAGGVTKPNHAPSPPTTPHHTRGSASRNGEARRKAPARQSEANAAQGGLRVGVGGRCKRCNQNGTNPKCRRPSSTPFAYGCSAK